MNAERQYLDWLKENHDSLRIATLYVGLSGCFSNVPANVKLLFPAELTVRDCMLSEFSGQEASFAGAYGSLMQKANALPSLGMGGTGFYKLCRGVWSWQGLEYGLLEYNRIENEIRIAPAAVSQRSLSKGLGLALSVAYTHSTLEGIAEEKREHFFRTLPTLVDLGSFYPHTRLCGLVDSGVLSGSEIAKMGRAAQALHSMISRTICYQRFMEVKDPDHYLSADDLIEFTLAKTVNVAEVAHCLKNVDRSGMMILTQKCAQRLGLKCSGIEALIKMGYKRFDDPTLFLSEI